MNFLRLLGAGYAGLTACGVGAEEYPHIGIAQTLAVERAYFAGVATREEMDQAFAGGRAAAEPTTEEQCAKLRAQAAADEASAARTNPFAQEQVERSRRAGERQRERATTPQPTALPATSPPTRTPTVGSAWLRHDLAAADCIEKGARALAAAKHRVIHRHDKSVYGETSNRSPPRWCAATLMVSP
jgi:hypothetical protein